MKSAALILLKIDEKKDFITAYKKLHSMNNAVWCEATRGDIDIFMKIENDSPEECLEFFNSGIQPLAEVKRSIFLPVSGSAPASDPLPGAPLHSFILAEADKAKFTNALTAINQTGNVSSCTFVEGDYNLVLSVNGEGFAAIDRFISNTLLNLDGIVKLKEYPVINIYEN